MDFLELNYGSRKGVAPFAYEVVGEWLYFCDLNLPGLFRYHFEKEVCECVTLFNNKYINTNFFKIFFCKDELWMLPFLDGKIVCFDIQTQEVSYYNIPGNIKEKVIPFIGMVFSEKEAFILPHGNNRFLIRLDLETHQMEEIEILKIKDKNNQVFFSEAVQFENRIYLFEGSRNIIFLFNINNNEVKIIDACGYFLKDRTVGMIGRKIYFFPWNIKEKLVIYDIHKNIFCEEEYPIRNLPQGEECAVMVFDKEIWILANKKKKIYRLNQNLEIQSIISILNFNKEEIKYVSGRTVGDRFFWHGHNGVPLIQVKDRKVQIIEVSKDRNILELYIEMINNNYIYHSKIDKPNVGKLIYETIK